MSPNDNRIDARDWSLLAVLSVLWGGSFFFNRAALLELPPLTLVFMRVALGAAILLPLLHIQGRRLSHGCDGLEAVRHDWAPHQRHPVLADRDRPDFHS